MKLVIKNYENDKQITKLRILLVFLFGLGLCISFGTEKAFGLQYVDEEQGFSINFPDGWEIDDAFFTDSDIDYLVTFYDDIDSWGSMLEIRHIRNTSLNQTGTDEQWLNLLYVSIEQNCRTTTIEQYGFMCSDHELIDAKTIYIDEKKSYQFTYSWTETLEDSIWYENISTTTLIPDGFDFWNIYSESTSDVFLSHKSQIISSVNSFDILRPVVKSEMTAEFTNDDRLVFEEDINSFIDLSPRPISLVTPVEFSPEWYVNEKNEFAIKFPHSWNENWDVNESFSGKKFAEFSSKNTNGKIEFFIEESNLFQKFNRFEKNRLYVEAQKMVAESISRFPGFFHVDSLGVIKFNDGVVVTATFFQIDQNGDQIQYDVSYLIYEDGKMVEVVYYGDNYMAVDINDYGLMLDSTYLGNTSLIPTSKKIETNSEIYVNYDLGVSFIPPKQWKQETLNTQFEPSSSTTIKLDVIVMFMSPNFQGFIPPTMVLGYANSNEPVNFNSQDEREQILQDTNDALSDSMGANTQFEIIDSNADFSEDMAKINIDATDSLDLDGYILERQLDIVLWLFENGEMYFMIFSADVVDFPTYHDEFTNSIDTVTFDEKPKTQQIEKISPDVSTTQQTENGGSCLIATATYGSELAPQVQQLREIRDSKLLQTESGTSFMNMFNDIYYSFSPIIADYVRENPLFKDAVKIAITPMISSLSILNHVDMDTEDKVLGYGISLILLNLGMYVGVPVGIVVGMRHARFFQNKSHNSQ